MNPEYKFSDCQDASFYIHLNENEYPKESDLNLKYEALYNHLVELRTGYYRAVLVYASDGTECTVIFGVHDSKYQVSVLLDANSPI